jgi:phosphate starvation-inducible PhoH-like protein
MKKLEIPEARIASVMGDRDENFPLLEQAFDVDLSMRGSELFVEGSEDAVRSFSKFLGQILELPDRGHELQKGDVRTAIGLHRRNPDVSLADYFVNYKLRPSTKKFVQPKSEHRALSRTIREATRPGINPAGRGKTYHAALGGHYNGRMNRSS